MSDKDKSEHKPDDKPGKPDGKGFEIVVNGQSKPVLTEEVTFKQVVELAGFELGPNYTYTVLWENGGGREPEGTMSEAGPKSTVKIKNGTEFDVTRNNRV